MQLGILLASHGTFAAAALESAQMLMGQSSGVAVCTLPADKSLECFEAEMRSAYSDLIATNDLVVGVCDILGGTPFNVLTRMLADSDKLIAYAGLSLPLVLELVMAREDLTSQDDIEQLVATVHTQVCKQILPPQIPEQEDEDDLDL